ncbi:hypothetical protein GHT09_007194 [Marmota monax]|uniref:Uncharacterized protein n=1 Tax=Marmota monax TaxID=9995 RepID=A0A834QRF4_MARMO|nr:hypothetical protein GHT09_007194 [Marmota monax]
MDPPRAAHPRPAPRRVYADRCPAPACARALQPGEGRLRLPSKTSLCEESSPSTGLLSRHPSDSLPSAAAKPALVSRVFLGGGEKIERRTGYLIGQRNALGTRLRPANLQAAGKCIWFNLLE